MRIFAAVAVAIVGVTASALAQGKCDENTVRKLSESPVPLIASDDIYFNAFAEGRPVVGKTELEELRKTHAGERKNQQPTRFHPDRIVATESADAAYDYGTAHVEFDETATGKHVSYDIGYLQVWKLVAGECRLAAAFSRTLEPSAKGK